MGQLRQSRKKNADLRGAILEWRIEEDTLGSLTGKRVSGKVEIWERKGLKDELDVGVGKTDNRYINGEKSKWGK